MIPISNNIIAGQTNAVFSSYALDQFNASERAITAGATSDPSLCLDERIYDLRSRTEEIPQTNFISNNTMVGASGGPLPDTWEAQDAPSLSQTITTSGTASGFQTVGVILSGTADTDNEVYVQFGTSGIVSTYQGDLFVGSAYFQLSSGSVSGITDIGLEIAIIDSTNPGIVLESFKTTFPDLSSGFVRFSVSGKVSVQGSTDDSLVATMRFSHNVLGGSSYDYRVIIGVPQLERGLEASPVITTSTGSVTRITGRPSILVVPQLTRQSGTNLAFNSQTWATGTNWNLTFNVTTATGTTGTLDPLGTNTANAISPTAVSGAHYLVSNSSTSVSYTSGTIYTQSAFFKQGTGDAGRYVQLTFTGGAFSQASYANFDLQLGTVTVVSGSSADSNRAASIENYGNGWYRCRLTATCNNTNSGVGVIPALITASGDTRIPSFAGVTGDILYGWGAQVEVGSTATPYIPTTTGSVFRDGTVFPQLPTVSGADFTFTRATTATRVNASGLIESVASGVLRLDYPIGGGCPAALIEPAGTNLAWHSETWASGTNWSLTRITTTTGTTDTLDPLGTNTANAISPTADSGTHLAVSNNPTAVSYTSGTIYTQSGFFKEGTGDAGRYVQLTFTNTRFTQLGYANFDLQTGALVASGGTADTNRAASIENYGNGWYRCRLTATCNNTGTGNGFLAFLITASGDTRLPSFTGVTGDVLYGWGAQLETGAIPTSYIPTTTASATRNADVCSVSGVSGYIGQTEGTIYVEVDRRSSSTGRIIEIGDGSSSNRILLRFISATVLNTLASVGGAGQWNISEVVSAGILKVALAYAQNDVVLYVNGLLANSTSSANIPAVGNVYLSYTPYITDSQLNDRIRAAAIYTTRLSNDQLASLTRLT